jgi:hypothetical protein
MKKHVALFLLIFLGGKTLSQDLIITNNNDSIFCKIKGIEGNDMLFDYQEADGIRHTLISLSEMKYYKYGYYKEPKKAPAHGASQELPVRVRFGLNLGLSYRTAKTNDNVPSQYKDYVEGLKSGYQYGIDFSYYFNEFIGIGFRASQFKSGKETTENGNVSDEVSISFIGPAFCTRLLNRTQKNALYIAIAMGYAGFRDEGVYYTPMLIKGSTFGLGMDLGYDIGLSRNWAIGFQLSALAGVITEVDVTQNGSTQNVSLEKENYESLARIDFSLGLRYRF